MSLTPPLDDPALARAAGAGSREALAAIYDRYAEALLGFCVSMLRNRATAEDCLQDVFVIAATRLGDLRQPERLRSWLFSVARHECLHRLDRNKRELAMGDTTDLDRTADATPDPHLDPVGELATAGAGPDLDAELADLIADAAAGMGDRDRLVLDLADRQGLDGDDLAGALGVPRATAYTLVSRARGVARTAVGSLLVARTGRGDCPELDSLLASWDGVLTPLLRKRINRHVERCDVCEERRRKVAAPAALFGSAWAAVGLSASLRDRVLGAADDARPLAGAAAHAGSPAWADGWPPADASLLAGGGGEHGPRRSGKSRAALVVAVLAALLAVGTAGVALAGRPRHTRAATGATPTVSLPDVGGVVGGAVRGAHPSSTTTPATVSSTMSTSTSTSVAPPSSLPGVPAPAGRPARTTTTSAPTTVPVPRLTVTAASSDVEVRWGPDANTLTDGKDTCTANSTCALAIPVGDAVQIIPGTRGSTFAGSPDCSGTSVCNLTFHASTVVTVVDPVVP